MQSSDDEPSEQKIHPDNINEGAKNQADKVDQPPISKAQAKCEPDKKQHCPKCNRRCLPWLNFSVQVLLFFAATGAFIAACYYASISYKQWSIMDQTFQEIKKQTTSAETSANAAKNAAKAAMESNNLARQALHNDERAFLYQKSQELHIFAHKPGEEFPGNVTLIIKVNNSGETAARRAITKVDFCQRLGGPPKDFNYPFNRQELPPILVAPKSDATISIPIPNDIWRNLELNKTDMIFYGEVLYLDIFNIRHRVQFCRRYSGVVVSRDGTIENYQWADCEEHNCDDDDCPKQWGKAGVECCTPQEKNCS